MESFEKDGHRTVISSSGKFMYNKKAVVDLREECLQLVCRVSQKYTLSRAPSQHTCSSSQTVENKCQCCPPTSFVPANLVSDSDPCSSHSMSDTDSIISEESGSLYSPEEYDMEPDDSQSLYDNRSTGVRGEEDYDKTERSFTDQQQRNDNDDDSSVEGFYSDYSNYNPRQETACEMKNDDHEDSSVEDGNCVVEDDSSVEEIYSDFNYKNRGCKPSDTDIDGNENAGTTDNLVCPGDVIEYRTMELNSIVKKGSIVSVEHSKRSSYIVLKCGDILHPKHHALRKIQMYDGATKRHIPNPYCEWVCVSNCILQSGSLLPEDDCEDDETDNEEGEECQPR